MKGITESFDAIAKKTIQFAVILYIVLKQLVYIFAVDGLYWITRGVAGLLMLAVMLAIARSRRLSSLAVSICMPLSIALIEIIYCAFNDGDRMIYIFLIGCSLASLIYINVSGLLITMLLTGLSIGFCAFVLKLPMMGGAYSLMDQFYNFLGLLSINILIYTICQYSVGALKRFRRTGLVFDRFMETTTGYMVVIDERARVEYISHSLADWLGVSDGRYAVDRPLLDLCGSGELKMVLQEVMEAGGNVEKDYMLTLNGQKYWFLLRSSLMGDDGIARTFEFANITPIMEAKLLAEEAAKTKSNFLANMSHEIRTPMNAIIGMTELLMTQPLGAEAASQASAIKGASLSLLSIINDILDFSKIDAEKMEIINKPFDVASFLNDTVNMINIKAASAGIAFTVHISKNIPPFVIGDELRIKQALLNLLNNAVKFTREGCVSLSVSSERVGNALKLIFTVTDTGIGIREEDMSRLFQAFSQLDTRKNRNIMGTGLGLAITRRLIELMDGAISVDSVYGKGSVFSFFVMAESVTDTPLVSLPHASSYHVLCFEPNAYHAEALSAGLSDLGISHTMCRELSQWEQHVPIEAYTHILFDKTALSAAERLSPGDSRMILLKDVHDTHLASGFAALSRPVLITSLAKIFQADAHAAVSDAGFEDVRLGAFRTRDARVLVIDDNPVNLMVAQGMLLQYGLTVITASGGREGVEKVRGEPFDLVFMDHMMPDMDGIDATRAIRRLGKDFAKLPIIALTANAIVGVERTFAEAGMNGFLSKPIVIRQLHRILLAFLPPEKIVKGDDAVEYA